MVALAGLVLIGSSVWFAMGWIDGPTFSDYTCGSLFRTDIWMVEYSPSSCRAVMTVRALIAAVLLTSGLVLTYLAARGRRGSRSTAAAVLAAAIVVSAVTLVINEAVRSTGALNRSGRAAVATRRVDRRPRP